MPELPEVETIRRQLEPRLAGRAVVDVWTSPNPKFTAAAQLRGASIAALGRRGKYLIAPLADRRELVLHLGMTGVLRYSEGRDRAPHVRMQLMLDDGARLELHDVRQFGRIAVVPAGDYRSLPTLYDLGPEPFDPEFTARSLYEHVRGRHARIKTQLLSQRPVAGVGNIYADEALWRAGLYPGARALTRTQAERLHAAVVAALAQGIANGGTTLRDYRNFDGGIGANQHQLDCYGRAGQPCRRCDIVLARRVFDGRGTTYCPRCQPSR